MKSCPLPIDWLDLLEGAPSPASRAHLVECPSCRAVVDALERQVLGKRFEAAPRKGRLQGGRPAWVERRPEDASFSEIWWTGSSFEAADVQYKDLDRIPILVLDVSEETEGPSWLEVVPLWTDWDNATSSDLLLEREHTSTAIPWRVLFRLQTVLERRQLDSCFGSLTDEGDKLIRDALGGRFTEARFGTELEDGLDPRLTADRWMEEIVHLLGRHEAAFEESEAEERRQQTPETGVLLFELREKALSTQGQPYALAAKTGGSGELAKHAIVETAGQVLEGYLIHDLDTDTLSFHVVRASGFSAPVRLVVNSSRVPEPVRSAAFIPEAGRVVAVATGQGLSHFDVTEMGLDIAP
ncbi:MAG: hypothetical protein ACREA0_02915 [bacterium]